MRKITNILMIMIAFCSLSLSAQDLLISGVYDGPLSGGTPKGVELYVINDIADMSIYGIGSANNGGGSDDEEFTFPADSYTAGTYLYISSEDVEFPNWFGFSPDYTTGAMAINGDDAIELFMNGNVIDVFGDINVDGTGEPWEYMDGWAYRVDGTGPDGSVFQLANFSYSGPDALDDETSNATAAIPFPTGTYTYGAVTTVATPVISPAPGDYFDPINVTISCATTDASIYYTTDGTDPDQTSTLYTTGFTVSTTTTVKARAYKTDLTESAISTNNYNFPTITSISTISDLRAQTVGNDYYKLTGEAVLSFQQSFRNQKFIQDATGGILIDDNDGAITTNYNIYDGITNIVGNLSEYGGMLQFIPIGDPGAPSSVGNTITPEVVTLSQLIANFDDYESELIQIESITFADAGTAFANGTVYSITDAGSNSYDFRTTFYGVDYIGTDIPGEPQNIVVIPNSRSDGEYITSRNLTDFSTVEVTLFPDFEADITQVLVGGSVNFTDLTTGDPTTWLWTFEGGTPETYDGQTPPPITYDTEGTFDVTLYVSDGNDEGEISYQDYIEVINLAPPTNLMAEVGPFNDVQLTWNSPVVNEPKNAFENPSRALLGFNVYRDDLKINTATVTETEYNDPEPTIGSHDYYVTTVYDEGESDPSNIVQVVVTDINEIIEDNISVYPNPSDGMINIETAQDVEYNVKIMDIRGKLIYENNITKSTKVNLTEFTKGIYLISLIDNASKDVFVKKLIIR